MFIMCKNTVRDRALIIAEPNVSLPYTNSLYTHFSLPNGNPLSMHSNP